MASNVLQPIMGVVRIIENANEEVTAWEDSKTWAEQRDHIHTSMEQPPCPHRSKLVPTTPSLVNTL